MRARERERQRETESINKDDRTMHDLDMEKIKV